MRSFAKCTKTVALQLQKPKVGHGNGRVCLRFHELHLVRSTIQRMSPIDETCPQPKGRAKSSRDRRRGFPRFPHLSTGLNTLVLQRAETKPLAGKDQARAPEICLGRRWSRVRITPPRPILGDHNFFRGFVSCRGKVARPLSTTTRPSRITRSTLARSSRFASGRPATTSTSASLPASNVPTR